MKKFRGKRRYFRFMWAEIAAYDLQLDEESWFAYKHHHLDFYGYGKTSVKIRRQHIKGHLALLDHLLLQFEHFQKPFQAWITLNDTYPEYDAVYIHTENPYDPFPYLSDDLQVTTELPVAYRDIIDLKKYAIAVSHVDGQVCYVLQVKGRGLSVTKE